MEERSKENSSDDKGGERSWLRSQLCEISEEDREELEKLMFKFGKARRRAYSLKRKGYTKSEIEKILHDEICLNSRYIKDAYHSVKDLPPHVTFGGLKNQKHRRE